MNPDIASELIQNSVMISLLVSAPVMLVAVVLGFIISLGQAVTQLQDQTISFVPKIVAMVLTGLYLLPWIISQLMDYTTELFNNIPNIL
ncbi:flagellar biosynthetic protein FliQ [Lacunimicrobium album]|jgi:flagellar biosynthetic protein FliQ